MDRARARAQDPLNARQKAAAEDAKLALLVKRAAKEERLEIESMLLAEAKTCRRDAQKFAAPSAGRAYGIAARLLSRALVLEAAAESVRRRGSGEKDPYPR